MSAAEQLQAALEAMALEAVDLMWADVLRRSAALQAGAPLAVTKRQAAAMLGGISEDLLETLISRGEIVPTRAGRRVLIEVTELERYLEAERADNKPTSRRGAA